MTLKDPFLISSRLLPAVKIGDCTVSLDAQTDRYYFDFESGESIEGNDFNPKTADVQEAMGCLLSFVGAFAEGCAYEDRNPGSESENGDLFPASMREWAMQNSDEISMLAYELEEGERVVTY